MRKPSALVLAVFALACGTRPGASGAGLATAVASATAATARSHHTATLLTDGRVLVAGGLGELDRSRHRPLHRW